MSIINVNVCLESNSTFQIILVDSLFTLSWGMADLLFVWQPLPFATCWREVDWIYIINTFGLTTLSVQRICIYFYLFYFSWVISVSVFGQVNNFAVVVGPNSSVWVSGIRGASNGTVTSLNPLFRVETLAAESLVVVFISNIDVSGIYIPPFFLWGYPSSISMPMLPCYSNALWMFVFLLQDNFFILALLKWAERIIVFAFSFISAKLNTKKHLRKICSYVYLKIGG